MWLSLVIAVSTAMALFVAWPLLAREGATDGGLPIDVTPQADLKRRRLVVYDNLKDLEFEFQAGKIATDDYEALRRDYMGEAAALMVASSQEGRSSSEAEYVERVVAARRAERKARPAGDYVCKKCGFENPLPVKFCGECGARIN